MRSFSSWDFGTNRSKTKYWLIMDLFRTSRIFLSISRAGLEQFGSCLRRKSSIWLQEGLLSLISRNLWIFSCLSQTTLKLLPCIFMDGRAVSRQECITWDQDQLLMPSSSLLISRPLSRYKLTRDRLMNQRTNLRRTNQKKSQKYVSLDLRVWETMKTVKLVEVNRCLLINFLFFFVNFGSL